MSEINNLFKEFAPISKENWLEKVKKDLKGKPLEDLSWHLEESIIIEPFYHSDDNIDKTSIVRDLGTNNWALGEDIEIDDLEIANKILLDGLANGVDAPRLVFKTIPSKEDFKTLLEAIIPNYIQLHFKITSSVTDQLALIENYYAYLQDQNIDTETLKGSFQFNADQQEVLIKSKKYFPSYKCLHLDFSKEDSNTSAVIDELTTILKAIDTLFQEIDAVDIPSIQVSIPIGTSYFVEIAKLRALRILWSNLLNAYQTDIIPLCLDGHVAQNTYDENTNSNMIRCMTIAMSAVIGGVDRLTILPADKKGSPFTKRIARNVQHLLKMESYLDRVVDPAAGSFYIEKLTRLFAEKTWDRFKAI